jgi:hypothetical protein
MIIAIILSVVTVFIVGVLVALKNGKKINDTATAVKSAANDITNAVK